MEDIVLRDTVPTITVMQHAEISELHRCRGNAWFAPANRVIHPMLEPVDALKPIVAVPHRQAGRRSVCVEKRWLSQIKWAQTVDRP
jgi:hypothetical protein